MYGKETTRKCYKDTPHTVTEIGNITILSVLKYVPVDFLFGKNHRLGFSSLTLYNLPRDNLFKDLKDSSNPFSHRPERTVAYKYYFKNN